MRRGLPRRDGEGAEDCFAVLVECAELLPAEDAQVVGVLHEGVYLVWVRGLGDLGVLRGEDLFELGLQAGRSGLHMGMRVERRVSRAYLLDLGCFAVEVLQLHVALRVGLHVGQRGADGERAGAGRVFGELGERLEEGVESRVVVGRCGQWR